MTKILEILYNEWIENKTFNDDSPQYRKAIRDLTNGGEDSEKFETLFAVVSAERTAAFEKGFYEAVSIFCRLE